MTEKYAFLTPYVLTETGIIVVLAYRDHLRIISAGSDDGEPYYGEIAVRRRDAEELIKAIKTGLNIQEDVKKASEWAPGVRK